MAGRGREMKAGAGALPRRLRGNRPRGVGVGPSRIIEVGCLV